MNDLIEFFGEDPLGGRERILVAVYFIVNSDGYDGVSVQRIADTADLSKGTVYHHFENKDEIMLAFYEFMLTRMVDRISQLKISDPIDRLYATVDWLLLGRIPSEVVDQIPIQIEDRELGEQDPMRAFIEVRTRAVYEGKYQKLNFSFDQSIRDELTESITEGIEQESIRNIDAEQTADMLYTMLLGGLLRRTTTGETEIELIQNNAHEFIGQFLIE